LAIIINIIIFFLQKKKEKSLSNFIGHHYKHYHFVVTKGRRKSLYDNMEEKLLQYIEDEKRKTTSIYRGLRIGFLKVNICVKA